MSEGWREGRGGGGGGGVGFISGRTGGTLKIQVGNVKYIYIKNIA